ncbi:MAG: L-2-amino-thiazoline-4-carboxylic acid hydrolase [Synergistaceae bacterium]|nr:L-2-amino-thiazoline-4-carboxylic acid hydrolase [Synergistaceae bacterium]
MAADTLCADRESIADLFYIDDHALLYGLIAMSAEDVRGAEGLGAITRAVIRYCGERGLRAAGRCLADGAELTVRSYILYGEWADTRGWCRAGASSFEPFYTTRVVLCPWCEAWKKHGLLKYGKIYCGHADRSLVHGFNPELRIEMGEILSCGGNVCEYGWSGFRFSPEDEEALSRGRAEIAPRVTRDFLYHCGHLLRTFREEIFLQFGLVQGRAIISKSLDLYGEIFGRKKTIAIEEESRIDFMRDILT